MYRVVAFLLLALAIGDSLACNHKGSSSVKPTVIDIGCGICAAPIDVTLVFRNVHQEPKFQFSVTVRDKHQRQLLFFLEEAARMDTRARFTSTFWDKLGYQIDSINKVKSNYSRDRTYWRILKHTTEEPLKLGVSSYIPKDKEQILFNFTNSITDSIDEATY